jgi:glutamyl/glutaminyl-tRNA synthetase
MAAHQGSRRGTVSCSGTPSSASPIANADQKVLRQLPRFAHVGLIFKDGKKMSKRDGASSLLDYRDRGYDPDAMFNFLLRIGWGPKRDDASSTFMDKEAAKSLFLTAGNMRFRKC